MTKDWYISNGYKLSSLIGDSEITRAEKDVENAYIKPIVGTSQVSAETVQDATGNLAFLLLLQRSIFATRTGAKNKTGYNSQDAGVWDILQQEASSCHLKLQALRAEAQNDEAEVVDICKIYFVTNFIHI